MEQENEHRSAGGTKEGNRNRRNHYYHKKNKSNGSNNGTGSNSNSGGNHAGTTRNRREDQSSMANGGYTSASRISNRSSSSKDGAYKKDVHTRDHYNRDRKRDSDYRRNTGYQPDTDKQAIRQFVLGTFEEEDKNYTFTFDCGTYRILEKEGKDEEIPAKEILNSRDKQGAYQSWNEIKRPKKGKYQRAERKEEQAKQK